MDTSTTQITAMAGEPWCDSEALCAYLKVDERELSRLRALGMPHVRLPGGRRFRYRPSEVTAWLLAQQDRQPAGAAETGDAA